MNEQAIQDSYDVFVSNGYTKSIDEFKKLINTNPNALKDSYDVFVSNGYEKSIDEYKKLMGVGSQPQLKKKDFSESAIPQQVQKADTTELSSEDGSLVTPPTKKKRIDLGFQNVPTDMSGRPTVSPKAKPALEKIAKNKEQEIIPKKAVGTLKPISDYYKEQEEENKTYLDNIGDSLMAGLNDVNKIITSIPETVYNVFSMPQNAIAYVTGLDISTDSDKFKKGVGITNPILDFYKEEGKRLEKEISNFNQKNYESSSVYENLKNGKYQDAFELLGSGIVRSAPTSIAMMAGGATLSTGELAAASTAAFYDQNLEQVKEENPNASDIENNIKALGMSAAESVFSSIGEGQIGAVYRDIIRKEGVDVGTKVFKDGLVQMYKGALEKYGVPVGLLGEGLEESATQITQNMINGKPAFEGAADAFILGGGSGVMFTAPISLKNAKDRIKNKIVEVKNKKEINKILEGSEESFSKVFDVSKDSEINEKQLRIASLDKSRDLLVKDLNYNVKKGNITQDQAKQSLYVFDKTKQITGQLRDIDIDNESKVKVANLLKERESLSEKIQGKDESLSVIEKERISEINNEIKDTILNSKEYAIQEQTTDESVLRAEQPELGLPKVGEGNAKPEELTAEETITNEKPEEVTIPSGQKVSDVINRPVTLESFGGFKLESPIEGDLYQEGQRIIFEDKNNKTYDLGSVDELGKNAEEIGLKPQEVKINISDEGKVSIDDNEWNMQMELPTKGIEYDKDNNIIRVSLKDNNGKTKMWDGQIAEDIGYQILLKEMESSENSEKINQILKENEQHQNRIREIENASKERADKGNESDNKQIGATEESIKNEGEFVETAPNRKGKNIRKVNQRTLKTVKEPLTKAEREANAKVEGPPPAPEVLDIVSEKPKVEATELSPIEAQESRVKSAESLLEEAKTAAAKKKAMKDLSTEQSRLAEMKAQEKVKALNTPVKVVSTETKPTEKIKGGDNLSNTSIKPIGSETIKQLTFQESFDLANLELKEISAKERTLSVQKEYEAKIKEINRIKELAAKSTETKDLLDLDTKDKTNLQKVSDYLEKLDRSLDLDPNELNDVTRVMAIGTAKAVIKTLKALVNAGITLQEAIKRASEVHEVEPEKIIEALDIVSKINENKSEGLSEFELSGYNRMMTEVEDIIKKTKDRLSRESVTDAVKKKRLLDAVMDYFTGSKVYEDASDVQRDQLVRDIRKRFGFSQKSAPSVGRLFGTVKDVNKITMTEKAALVKQIRDLGRGARDAVKAWRLASQQLSKDIKELRALGKITTNQAANVMRAFSKVNVFSQKSVDRFTTYMTKVFEKADYADKLKTAKDTRSKIKKLAKNKDKNANLRDLASKFGKIEPSLVEDIDAYNELATQIKNATDGSKIRGQKVNFAETVNIANATDYVTKQIESQDKIFRAERIAELEELYGVDGIGFTDEEIKALLESDNPIPKENRDAIMATIKKAFNIYSTLIKDSISNGVDAFTGEDISFTKKETDIIEKFMSMDLNKIGEKNALQAVDALANFIENKSTAKMAATVATYTGDVNAEEVVKKGIYAVPLKKIWSPQFGSFLAEQTTTLPMLFEKMFKGFNRGGAVMDAMGITKLINRKSFAERQANNIVADYVKQFYNTKANGEAFNTAYNNTERGMAAFMLRNVIGTEQEMKAEFDRRKGLIEQSIDALSQGSQQQKKQAELYQKVYDKVVLDSKNLQDIKDKTDPKNLEAIDYWHNQWESKFDQLSDVASGIYNKILKKDLNYSPDKYSKIKQKSEVDLINNDESAFIANTNGVLYNKKTGVLMDVTNSSKLPLDSKNKPISFVDLSFDKNNSNSMYDALIDIETAEPIRQVQAFLNSDSYSKIIPDADNADMLARRIDTYVRNTRKKSPFTNDEFSKTIKKLNKIATLGVGQALGGVTQPIKQVVPVALNTLVNGQGLAVGASFNPDFVKWLNESGYAIANRGVQSQADIETLNALIEEASNSTGKKLLDKIEEANAFMLKWFLEKPDVFIAKASWKTYYEKSLKQQGKYDGKIDYSNHPINEEAANYAQRMVDRQQNISDHDLAGNLFTDRSPKAQVLAKIFMPFASFRMNQAARLATDLSVLGHWSVSTKEDKKVALLSLASFATEMAVFKALSAGIGIALGYAANAWMDRDETDEEEDKRIANALKGQATGAVTDIISPLPVFDKMLQTGAAMFLEGVQEGLEITDQDKLALYSAKPEGYLKNLGLYGMTPDKILELGKLISLASTGKYTDDFGREHTISKKDRETLSVMIGPALMTNIGLAPSEVSGVIRSSIKLAKKARPTMTKTELKERFPEKYEEQYGENSRNYEIEQEQKEREKEQKERMKRN